MNQDLYMERDAIIPDPERLRDITLRVEQALNQWHLQLLAKI